VNELTTGQIAERIQKQCGATWSGAKGDGFVAGSPETKVTGILTVWTPGIDVLRSAVAKKQNLIVSQEPPYWFESSRTEVSYGATKPDEIEQTQIYKFKKSFIEKNNLTIFRLHTSWDALPGNFRLRGLANALGWANYYDADGSERLAHLQAGVYTIPQMSLLEMVKHTKKSIGAKGIRATGDPESTLKRVVMRPGFVSTQNVMDMVQAGNVDAVICGEACEWQAFPYLEDWITAGVGKAMVMLGRVPSEDPGAKEMAVWLRSFIKEIPVASLPVGDAFNYIPSIGTERI
jgi:putative NIF3 family GTP cyclohydrolase 1 type 2